MTQGASRVGSTNPDLEVSLWRYGLNLVSANSSEMGRTHSRSVYQHFLLARFMFKVLPEQQHV